MMSEESSDFQTYFDEYLINVAEKLRSNHFNQSNFVEWDLRRRGRF
jgi:hypothetical protein